MPFMKANDLISGQEATAYAVINGSMEPMFYAKNLRAEVKKEKNAVKTLGKRGTQYKSAGWSGKGSMTLYYATSLFRKQMLSYMKGGSDASFDIQVVNDDPASSIGRQTMVLKNVSIDSVVMAAFDVNEELLDEQVSFTFDDVEILEEFSAPSVE